MAKVNAIAAEPCSLLFLLIFLHSERFAAGPAHMRRSAPLPPTPAPLSRPTPIPRLRGKENRHHIHPLRIFKLFGASLGNVSFGAPITLANYFSSYQAETQETAYITVSPVYGKRALGKVLRLSPVLFIKAVSGF